MKTCFPLSLTPWLALAVTFPNAFAADLSPAGTNSIIGVVRFTNVDAGIVARLGPPGNEGMSAFVVVARHELPCVAGQRERFGSRWLPLHRKEKIP